MQISIPTARVTTPCRRLHDVVAGTVVFLPFLETPSRAFPRPLFLVSCSLHHPPGHAYSSCHLPSESENELFTYLRYVNGISVVPRCPSIVEEELRWRGWPSQPRKLAQEGDNRWTWSVLERERERENSGDLSKVNQTSCWWRFRFIVWLNNYSLPCVIYNIIFRNVCWIQCFTRDTWNK